ncbi:MAG TPA: ATP-dependent RNA helicase HrpA [Acidimicrobiales bacterium]
MARRPSPELVERRRASVPAITFPEQLPVSQRRDEIAEAIRDHQVVIVAGETGSGKTTQLPKICLELGRGIEGTIGHTQPRRLAARTVAARIAEELHVEVGDAVGYAVRFTDRVRDTTLVKLMTDGILLNELQRDRMLRAYDTIIIDEAHERSLNIDFLLGYLAQLLPQRPDLKVIVTSATIETDRFSEHFGGAPIIEVSGRTFPVEMRYRPLEAQAGDQIAGITDAVRELRREGPGDVLVFLSGEREIRDTADALRALELTDTEVLPLYARLSTGEQQRVFQTHRGRRIVLATNVAETSITVPGIHYVVDPGTARISRFSQRLKVQRLPIEPVSQASANQRAGRCGRVADGVCIRLYDEDDFDARPEYTEPEILRTNLASVILQMTAIGLGDIEAFPFLDPPDRRAIADGIRLLEELGALEPDDPEHPEHPGRRLTDVGRRLARLPIDPRFGRMVLEAGERGCLREVLVIAAALSIQDPRERPADQQAQADQQHARFNVPGSDFLAFLQLWHHVRTKQRELSGSRFRRMCRDEYLNFLRIREWADVHSQLRQIVADLGMTQNREEADPDEVHKALLAGLLSHVGQKDRETREYLGARQARFAIFPGSSLSRKPPAWVMAAELVETSRLFARTVAGIEPEWAEELGEHLVKRSFSEPHWSSKRGAAMARERVTLYGLPVVTDRVVPLARVDRELARELFVRHALVEGDWHTHHAMFRRNRELLAELDDLEHRFRRRDLALDDDALEQLYLDRLPAKVVSARHFDSWWKKARRHEPDRLTFTLDDLLGAAGDELHDDDFPARWQQGPLALGLSYLYEPGSPDDGVAVHVPVGVLNQLRPDGFEWLVPGLRAELITALVRALPKELRRPLVPVPDHVDAFLAANGPDDGPLLPLLSRHMGRAGGQPVPVEAWDLAALSPHLRMTYRVEDPDGKVLGESKDLGGLQQRLARDVRQALSSATRSFERRGLVDWDFGELPRRVRHDVGGQSVEGFPALVDEGESVGLRLVDSAAEQVRTTWRGERRLLRLTVPLSMKGVQGRLTNATRLALAASPYPSVDALLEECVITSIDALMRTNGAPVWDAVAFDELRASVRAELEADVLAVVRLVGDIASEANAVDRRIGEPAAAAFGPALDDVAEQRGTLVYPGFVAATGRDRLADVLRYLQAISFRLDKLGQSVARDTKRMATVHAVDARFAEVLEAIPPGGPADAELTRIGWMIEELRVSLFAQPLGAAPGTSEKRILDAIAAVPR